MSNINEMNVGPRWYVAHTYSGYENKVKTSLEKVIENRGLGDRIFDIRIPVETVIEKKGDVEKEVEVRIFLFYVYIKMVMNDETWHAVRNIIGVTATANFTFDDTQSDYRWAFVVTEDGMKGPEGDRYWMQQNKYVGDTDWLVMPEMKPFVNGSGLMEMEYDHVAVDGAGVRQGLENSVVPPIVKGEPNTFTYDIDISANTQIQNRDNLHVVAILLSSKYNDVENAAVCEISPVDDTTPLSLRPVLQEQKEMPHVFNLEGKRINNSSVMQGKGIRILEGKAYLNH